MMQSWLVWCLHIPWQQHWLLAVFFAPPHYTFSRHGEGCFDLELPCILLCLFFCADHYAAKLAGLVPTDPLAAALADQAYFFVEDVLQVRPGIF
jgi:hypothetical protein